jgi:hypothetical protein
VTLTETTKFKAHPRRISGNFSSLAILSSREELLILFYVKIISARKVGPAGQLESQLRIIEAL